MAFRITTGIDLEILFKAGQIPNLSSWESDSSFGI
jgi:hypothetical protein